MAKEVGSKGYSAVKGARAAARRTLGDKAQEGKDYTVQSIAGGRYDWLRAQVSKVQEPAPEPEFEPDPNPPQVSAQASAFGAAAMAALSVVNQQQRQTAPKPTAGLPPKKVRTPNEVKNNVRRPTKGTLCGDVWDALDEMVADNKEPDSKAVRALAVNKGWNLNNASIEFYQWRKFNGISGRKAT